MKNATLKIGAVCVALSGTLGWQAANHAKYVPPATQEKTQSVGVKIDNFSFIPKDLIIAGGTKVTWVNRDDIPHNVRSTEDKFKSKALDTGDTYSFTFDTPGTYEYFCSIHPKMTGKIIVQ